ncbi:MAG: DUF1080 domain-containing protein [Acidobacteria bacterium]|nr:DUF1080 domain-containing protein [Acidobacteriota bacterium]
MKIRALLVTALLVASSAVAADKSGKWIKMFDGKSLKGWKAGDNPEAWTVKNGMIVGDGQRSHLFYMLHQCENCEFKADVKLNHEGNSGMYFRATEVGPGWPKGYEAQVENTSKDPQKTGGLYNIAKIFEQLVQDDTWWNQRIVADGKHIQIFVNEKKVVDVEDGSYSKGYLALQQHNKGSVVEYKNLYMRVLPPKK